MIWFYESSGFLAELLGHKVGKVLFCALKAAIYGMLYGYLREVNLRIYLSILCVTLADPTILAT